MACLFLAGCDNPIPNAVEGTLPETVELANPWVTYDTLADAENAVGFSLGLYEAVEGSYEAQSFRVMDGELLEVVYRDDDFQVTVRKMAGENQDISGIYDDLKETYRQSDDALTIIHRNFQVLTLISMDGYSYSLYAPNGYWGASMEGFVCGITGRW